MVNPIAFLQLLGLGFFTTVVALVSFSLVGLIHLSLGEPRCWSGKLSVNQSPGSRLLWADSKKFVYRMNGLWRRKISWMLIDQKVDLYRDHVRPRLGLGFDPFVMLATLIEFFAFSNWWFVKGRGWFYKTRFCFVPDSVVGIPGMYV